MKTLSLQAHAKVNLRLFVGKKRKDGYHSLRTLFQEISLHDSLAFSRRSDSRLRLRVTGIRVGSGPDNLVLRALQMIRAHWGVQEGLNIRLTKRIPLGAGLGGGSSDAAAALGAGWRLWAPLKDRRKARSGSVLHSLAKKLGADVPFFLRGGRAWATGIGDRLRPVRRAKKEWYVLLTPPVHVSTKGAYGLLDRARRNGTALPPTRNSFQPVIFKTFPKIEAAASELARLGCRDVMLSGSGSTVFGSVRTVRAGQQVLRYLKKRHGAAFLVSSVPS